MSTFVAMDVLSYRTALMMYVEQYRQSNPTVLTERVVGSGPTESVDIIRVPVTTLQPLTRQGAHKILEILTRERLSMFCMYMNSYEASYEVAQVLHGKDRPDEIERRNAELFLTTDSMDNLTEEINQAVGQYVDIGTYRDWQVVSTPTMIAMIGGDDRRLIEWHQQNDDQSLQPNEECRVDVRPLMGYLYRHLQATFGVEILQWPITPLLADAVVRYFPNLGFPDEAPVPYVDLTAFGITNYNEFYYHFLANAVNTLCGTYLSAYINREVLHHATITPSGYLAVQVADSPRAIEAQACQEIRLAVERGDWVPEGDRRRLNQFERTHVY